MRKVLTLSLIAVFFTACSEIKMPQLPKVQQTQKKSKLTEAECMKLIERYNNEESMTLGEEADARYCEKKYAYSPSVDDMIENIEKLGN